LVEAERYFFVCCRYIELNPVRARIVDKPGEYHWSSYRCNALGSADRVLTPHVQYKALGARSQERQQAYRELFRDALPQEDLQRIRRMTKVGWPLGDEPFKDEIERMSGRLARPPKRGRPQRRAAVSADTIRSNEM
jgi:putative transposase